MDYRWSADKDAWLRAERGIGFEELVAAMESGGLRNDRAHPHSNRVHQRMLWVEHGGRVWVLPYVQDGEGRFLKTAYPSRQARKKLAQGEQP